MKKALFVLVLALCAFVAHAAELPARPLGFVNDLAGRMKPEEVKSLDGSLAGFQDRSKVTITVVTISSPQDYGFADLTHAAQAIGDTWKPGDASRNSGIIILVSGTQAPYKVRIAPAKGMEGAVTDLQSKLIVDNVIKPKMNAGDFAGGVTSGVQELMKLTAKEFSRPVAEDPDFNSNFAIAAAAVFAFLLLVVFLMWRSWKREKVRREEEERREAQAEARRAEQRRRAAQEASMAPLYRSSSRPPPAPAQRRASRPEPVVASPSPSSLSSRRRDDDDDPSSSSRSGGGFSFSDSGSSSSSMSSGADYGGGGGGDN